ncbi:glycosyltransferase family 4 protein [Kineococcus sp. SYSU DK006]|uniref:glycosyltransferase family 4 protein n=1 Tax=Kineococcus sp. SYSU DK006 TaxID=3383127 RepID=UPI003D7CAFAE
MTAPGGRPLRVLHVAEALGGGVATVVEDYVRSTPELEHVLLAWRRPGAQTHDALDQLVSRTLPLPAGHLAQLQETRRQVRALAPDIIHAHSSIAGALVRVGVWHRRRSTVYTPHCFAFERSDVGGGERALYWAVEALLGLSGRWVAAVGPHEARLAQRLPGRADVHVIPQVAPHLPVRAPGPAGGLRVVTVGRMSAQKDPGFFADVVRRARRAVPDSSWTWVGGGDPEQERQLREAGVHVTGWVPRARALQLLAEADAYLHTAAWEGSPMSVFEAASLGLPIVGRRIGPLEHLGLSALAADPEGTAALLARLAHEPGVRERLTAESRQLAAHHHSGAQRTALLALYQRVSPGEVLLPG